MQKPVIIIKADDLEGKQGFNCINPSWERFFTFLQKRKIPSSVGIISRLAFCKDEKIDNFIKWSKDLHETGLVEFWNHGHTHEGKRADAVWQKKRGLWKSTPSICNYFDEDFAKWPSTEFRYTDYEKQLYSIKACQKLTKKYLGITLKTFGAPFNATDENTIKALKQVRNLKVWFFLNDWGPQKCPRDRLILQGSPLAKCLDLSNFRETRAEFLKMLKDGKGWAGWRESEPCPYIVLQCHPCMHSSAWPKAKKIILYLIENDYQFTTPFEYYKSTLGT